MMKMNGRPPLYLAVARLLRPRTAELPGHPGEGGGGARPSRATKIHRLQTEATAGPTTT